MNCPRPVCLKVVELRKRGTADLREHLADPANVHICRRGRVFIGSGSAKHVFIYPQSPWANPYKVGVKPGEYSLEESLRLYEEHLDDLLRDPKRRIAFWKLGDAKTIGCFCALGQPCHRDVVLSRLRSELVTRDSGERAQKRAKIEPDD